MRLRELLEGRPDYEVMADCQSVAKALDVLAAGSIDLLLGDVHLEDGDIFELAHQADLAEGAELIVVAGSEGCAVQAFEVGALDCIVEPASPERLHTALDRAVRRVRRARLERRSDELLTLLESLSDPGPGAGFRPLSRLVARLGETVEFIPVFTISHITAEDYYVRVHTGETSYLVRETLKDLEARLPESHFVRTHRSAIVNVHGLRRIEGEPEGGMRALLSDGSRVPVARSRVSGVIEAVERSTGPIPAPPGRKPPHAP